MLILLTMSKYYMDFKWRDGLIFQGINFTIYNSIRVVRIPDGAFTYVITVVMT